MAVIPRHAREKRQRFSVSSLRASAKQSRAACAEAGLLRRSAPRNDENRRNLLAPARRGRADQRLERDREGGFEPARERAAIGGEHAAADPGVVRQLGKTGKAAAGGEPIFKKLCIAAFGAAPEHKDRADRPMRPKRRRRTKHRFA